MDPECQPLASAEALDQAQGCFPTTQWTALLSAGHANSAVSRCALETFCRSYWQPVYVFLRRQGLQPADAQDLTQAFFVRFLEKNYLTRLEHREGRFRSFLLTFLKRFLSDERQKAAALKRGGGKTLLSLEDFALEEERLSLDQTAAEHAFDRRWAINVLDRAQERLRREYALAGKTPPYEVLQPFLSGGEAGAKMAERLGMPENSLKSAIHRLRRWYAQRVREEIASTVETPSQVDEELRYLLSIVGGR